MYFFPRVRPGRQPSPRRNVVAEPQALLTACDSGQVARAPRARDGDVDLAEQKIIDRALRILEARLRYGGDVMTSPQAVRDLLRLRMANLGHEVFHVIFLNAQNAVIAAEEMFRGTLAQTSVYPREVVKAALGHNAAAVIFCHNHPSGVAEPSRAERIYAFMIRNAVRAPDYFLIPPERVAELGTKVEM